MEKNSISVLEKGCKIIYLVKLRNIVDVFGFWN